MSRSLSLAAWLLLCSPAARAQDGAAAWSSEVEPPAPAETVQASPPSDEAARLVRRAARRLAVKDYWGALADADRAIAVDPDDAEAYSYRAAADNAAGRYEEAVRDATRALIVDPGDASLRDERAWALNRLGRYRDAIADSNHSLEVNPKGAYAFANLGYAHERLGDYDAALRDLKQASVLDSRFEPVYRDASWRHGGAEEAAARTVASESERRRREAFLVVLAGALLGGLMIALGLLHLRPGPLRRSPSFPSGYAVLRAIGWGAMGTVYEAFDRSLHRKVALKTLVDERRGDGEARAALLAEARTIAALRHPGIVDIHAVTEEPTGLCLVLEYLDGRTLESVLHDRGRLPLREAKALLSQVCAALEYSHERLVVHRDLKPANIMIDRQGQVKLLDFGISRRAAYAPDDAAAAGTPEYMAPEQESGQARKESDVFSLGVCLYEMTTGRRPFAAPADAAMKQARKYKRPSQLDPSLPPELDALVDGALHPDPDLRVHSPRDFWALLERIPNRATRPF